MNEQLFVDSLVAINIAISLFLWCFVSLWTLRSSMPVLLRRQTLLMISVLFPVLMAISLSHASWGVAHANLFWAEILLTVLAGPVFFDFVYGRLNHVSVLRWSVPAASCFFLLLLRWDMVGLVLLVPVIFTSAALLLWLLDRRLRRDEVLNHVLSVALTIHLAQLLRFLGRDLEWLDELVPFTATLLGLTYMIWLLLPKQQRRRQASVNDCTASVFESVDQHLKTSKCYRNPELKLEDLAADLGLRSYLVSQAINQHAGRFNDYINKFRIDAFISDYRRTQNITALANRVGFNSKSAFYRAFRAETGMTPTQYSLS